MREAVEGVGGRVRDAILLRKTGTGIERDKAGCLGGFGGGGER